LHSHFPKLFERFLLELFNKKKKPKMLRTPPKKVSFKPIKV
jgi:hypothetical protein